MLQQGDVIVLKQGHVVYAMMPEKFIEGCKATDRLREAKTEIGKIYTTFSDFDFDSKKKQMTEGLQKFFTWYGFEINETKAAEIINSNVYEKERETFTLNGGEFVVIKAERISGGTGHGAHDDYPDEYQVVCRRLNNGRYDAAGEDVCFYQSVFVDCKIIDIEPIRKMKVTYL